eukprot:14934525-Ditylum_brightwellii.AAC.1
MGQHLMVLLSQIQLVSGSVHLYLENVAVNRDYVPQSWIGGIRRFLSYAKGIILVHKAWKPTVQRTDDVILVNVFKDDKPGTAMLDHLNRVRLFLGATSLADLCDDDVAKPGETIKIQLANMAPIFVETLCNKGSKV